MEHFRIQGGAINILALKELHERLQIGTHGMIEKCELVLANANRMALLQTTEPCLPSPATLLNRQLSSK